MSTPKTYTHATNEITRIRAMFADRLHLPCYVVGNGPSSTALELTPDEAANAVIFRMNWFFLEDKKRYGRRIDGFFWSVPNDGLQDKLRDIESTGEYDIRAFFQPFNSDDPTKTKAAYPLGPTFDHWAIYADNPTLARFMMGRPLPTQGMQVIGFAAALGFKDIRISGIDLYSAAARRYAWDVPADIQLHLQEKDVAIGYEKNHSLDLDLAYLRAVRENFDVTLSGLPQMSLMAPYINRILKPTPTSTTALSLPDEVFVTLAEGDYVLGCMALARSLQLVTDRRLLVLHTSAAVRRQLQHLPNVDFKLVKPLPNPHSHGQKRFKSTYTKLRVFELLEYSRVIFVDADCVVLSNIDNLFATEGFYAAPDWGSDLNDSFNSGVFAFSPSSHLCERVIAGVIEEVSDDGGDQGLLNALLKSEWTPLPPEYNTLKRLLVHHPTLINMSDVKVLHFVGPKPWDLGAGINPFTFLTPLWANFLHVEDWRKAFNVWQKRERTKEKAASTKALPPAVPANK